MFQLLYILTLFTVVYTGSYKFPCPKDCRCLGIDLDCSERNITSVPLGLPDSVKTLKLDKNNIRNIATNSLTRLQLLRTLNLGFNQLTEIRAGDFEGLLNLRNLDLSFNEIENIDKNAMNNLNQLKDINLQGNKLTGVDGVFNGLSNVNRIDLSKNQLSTISSETFKDIPSIRYIILRENNISSIDINAFRHQPLLTYFSFSNNPIGNVDGLFRHNNILTYLELTNCSLNTFPKGLPARTGMLYLNQNHFTSITRKELELYKMIITFHLSENAITTIDKGAFSEMTLMKELDLSFNLLTEIPLVPNNTKVLSLDRNEITEINKDDFLSGSELEKLSIQSNGISSLENGTFENLKYLKELYLGGNTFTEIPDFIFEPATLLEKLDLKGMEFTFIGKDAFSGLSNLEHLTLAHTEVDDNALQGNIFKPLKKLKFLDLQESPQIAELVFISNKFDMLRTLHKVESLNLMDNNLETLNKEIMTFMPRLYYVNIEGNKFYCDRRLLWLWKWIQMQSERFENADDLQCASPLHLRGQAIIKMEINNFVPTTLKPVILSTKGQLERTTTPSTIVIDSSNLQNKTEDKLNITNDTESSSPTMVYVPNKIDSAILHNSGEDGNYEGKINNILIITVVVTIAVVLFAVVVTAFSCLKCDRKKDVGINRTETFPDNDVTFYVISDEAPPLPPPNPAPRDRGSVSSTRDITDDKVFTIETDT